MRSAYATHSARAELDPERPNYSRTVLTVMSVLLRRPQISSLIALFAGAELIRSPPSLQCSDAGLSFPWEGGCGRGPPQAAENGSPVAVYCFSSPL